MQKPWQITSHDFPLPEAIHAEIRERATKLDSYYDGIIACRVVMEAPGLRDEIWHTDDHDYRNVKALVEKLKASQ